jgi:hypothetical protein
LDIELARSLPLANTVEKVSSALASIAAADTSKHRLSRDFQSRSICDFCNSIGTYRTSRVDPAMSVLEVILLQKSKVASVRIFGETLKREAVDDSGNLSRVTEVAYEFCVRRWGPSDFYMKTAPAALRIFDTFSKTTFATLSRLKRTSCQQAPASP